MTQGFQYLQRRWIRICLSITVIFWMRVRSPKKRIHLILEINKVDLALNVLGGFQKELSNTGFEIEPSKLFQLKENRQNK